MREPAERAAIVDTVVRLASGLDSQDWEAVRACLAPELDTDYSSFRGTPPGRLTAEEFIRLRQSGLVGLDTQHVTFDHQVEVMHHGARCRCDFVIRRWPLDATDQRFLHSYGHYLYLLDFLEGAWRIVGITQVVERTEGAPELHGAFRKQAQAGA